jgi:hypothetical protein
VFGRPDGLPKFSGTSSGTCPSHFAHVPELVPRESATSRLYSNGRKQGATGFDCVGGPVAACPGPRVPGKTLGKVSTANNNFALAA